MSSPQGRLTHLLFTLALLAPSCAVPEGVDAPIASGSTLASQPVEYDIERDPDVPSLPFDDNPDPAQCGIPVQWGESNATAWLSGNWEGELIQSEVLVYDSHLRVSVTGGAPHGTEVTVVLFQENNVLDYYFVRIPGDPVEEGWVPEPFLSFEPVT
jgi:hypothetical protein